jgi:uncharacterized membrane protein
MVAILAYKQQHSSNISTFLSEHSKEQLWWLRKIDAEISNILNYYKWSSYSTNAFRI